MFEFDALGLAVIGLAFLAGGLVKGVIGIGLPLVVVPVIATYSNPLNAIALMFVPAITSNVMQAYQAELNRNAVRRFWPAIAGVMVGSVAGTTYLTGAAPETTSAILGIVVLVFCASQLLGRLRPVSPSAERWVTPVLGTASGVIGGLTGFFGLTLAPYLLSLELRKEEFVATIAVLYLSGIIVLYLILLASGAFHWPMVTVSAAAALPTLAGVWSGSRLRRRVAESAFRRLLLVTLLLIAANLLRKSLAG